MYVYLETWTDDPHRRDEGPALHVSLMFQEVLKPPNSRALGRHFHYFGEICPKWLVFFSGEAWYWRLANSHWFATICSCFPSENEALQCFTCVPQINPLFNNTFFSRVSWPIGLQLDVISFNAAINACSYLGWKQPSRGWIPSGSWLAQHGVSFGVEKHRNFM